MPQSPTRNKIPTQLTLAQFNEFVLPYLKMGSRGPQPMLDLYTIFNYIMKLLYLGCQWKELPIAKDEDGLPEIHYTSIYGALWRFEDQGCFDAIFAHSVWKLHQTGLLGVGVIHGYGTTTTAKKGDDNLGFSGHNTFIGDKMVAFCDRHCNVIAPFVAVLGNRNESPLLLLALPQVIRTAKHVGLELHKTIVSLDAAYDNDSRANRKAIFNRGMIPNIPKNPRGRSAPKRGRQPLFEQTLYRNDFSPSSGCSPGQISSVAYCCALNASASCTMP